MRSDPLDADTLVAEVASDNFEDTRLTKRLSQLVATLGEAPERSLPSLFTSAGLEGAYRFVGNPRVTPEAILRPHITATRERCAQQNCVLVVHDTTDFTFGAEGDRRGLGRSIKSTQTFYGHISLAVTADGMRKPLPPVSG